MAGLDLWFAHGDVAYGHLVAFNDLGYANRASYATKWAVLEHFAADPSVRFVDLGGAAEEGLASFKRGWSNAVRVAHLCSRVLQPAVYDELCRARGAPMGQYFPAYRTGELTDEEGTET